MTRTRRFLMVACVATALAADRVAAAAPAFRPQVLDVARRVTRRLVVSFRQTVPAVRMVEVRRELPEPTLAAPVAHASDDAILRPFDCSPRESRLPPPAL